MKNPQALCHSAHVCRGVFSGKDDARPGPRITLQNRPHGDRGDPGGSYVNTRDGR